MSCSGCRVLSRVRIQILGLFLAVLPGCQQPAPPAPPPPPIAVQFVFPTREAVTPYEEFGGRANSSETVEIRARVTGYLKPVHFKDGADVTAGDLLFEIEDASYIAELAQAKATVKQREADVKRLQNQLERAIRLKVSDASTQQDIDRLTFEVDAAVAAQAAAVALQDQARLNLDFTHVKAPISGRIGRRLVDPGNLVQADVTPLGVIVSLDPIYAYFDYDERSVLAMRRMVDEGLLPEAPDRNQPVAISLAGEERYDLSGKINWVDNQIDLGTGTLRARVSVRNTHGLLTPGMFVRLRVPLGPEQQAVLIPEQALGADQGQRFVYVVTPADEIEYRRVNIGWLHNGKRVITSGLTPKERVVLTGLQRIRAKTKVTAKEWVPPTAEPPASAAQTAASAKAEPAVQIRVGDAPATEKPTPSPPDTGSPSRP